MTVRRQIMPGDLVVHEYDRPRGRCVRLVSAVRPHRLVTWYLTAGHAPKLNCALDADPELLTRIELFGVRAVRIGWYGVEFREHTAPSIATYRDGEPRRWQGALPEPIAVRMHVHDRWLKLIQEAA